MKSPRSLTLSLAVLASLRSLALEPIHYNNPGLTVDLAVGLWATPLPMDFDHSGTFDLAVVCADKPYNGTWVFHNATGDTAKNPFPIFQPARRISGGQFNVQVSYIGEQQRVLTPANEYPDFLHTGLDHPKKLALPDNVHPNKVRGNFWKYVDYDGDGKLDLVVGADDWTDYGWDDAYDQSGKWQHGPLHGYVYLLHNAGTNEQPVYEAPTKLEAGGKPMETFGWPAPQFADFSGSGKLDLICGEFLDGFTYFENIGSRKAPKYAAGRPLKTPEGQSVKMDLEMIQPTAIDWNKDGHPDLVVGDEDGRVAFIENTGKLDDTHTPIFKEPHYFQQEADLVKFGALASPFGVDWNGDGAIDIISGDSAGYVGFIENLSKPGEEHPRWAAPKYLEADGKPIRIMAGPNGSIQGPAEAKWGYTTLSVADWDGDGLPDIIVNSIWGKVVWYRNIGTRTAPKLAAAQPVEVEWESAAPKLAWGWQKPEGKALLTQWRTTPYAIDWNHDGLIDLVMLDQEGYLAFFERAKRDGKLVLLPPKRVFCDEKGEPLQFAKGPAGKSGRRKICLVDWDGDGKTDILINSGNAEWWQQVGERDGKFLFKNMRNLDTLNLAGHDTSPTTVDWNNDGIPDLLLGAEDGHFYYLKNPRSK
jgi:hypothetical protein